jgi:tetratricopeptide (TPR) repeat protein
MTLTFLVALVAAQLQPPGSWIGRRVILHYGAKLMVGNRVVDDQGRSRSLAVSGHDRNVFRVYRVEQVSGAWLWLIAERAPGVLGWAAVDQVVPYEEAIDYLTEVIRNHPSSKAYNDRGNVWQDQGKLDRAISDFSTALLLDPHNEVAYFNRGNARYARKDYDTAIADFGEAIRLDPKYVLAYHNRGNVWGVRHEYDKAIADFGEAIRLDPNHASAYNNRAWLWATCPDAKFRDGKKAVESATKASVLTEWKDVNTLDTLAAACAEAGDFAAAMKWIEQAIGLLSDEKAKADYSKRLDLYKARKPYHQPPGAK